MKTKTTSRVRLVARIPATLARNIRALALADECSISTIIERAMASAFPGSDHADYAARVMRRAGTRQEEQQHE